MPEYYIYDQRGRLQAEATLVNTTVNGTKQIIMYLEYQYIWGMDRVLAQFDILNNELYYYLYNGHGDVIQIVDIDGNIVNSYDYDVWGNFIEKEETIHNPFTYFGQTYDETTGLYYLRARYYDPTTGRFTQQDAAEDGYNWYVYCGNNPIIFIDPLGLYDREAATKFANIYYKEDFFKRYYFYFTYDCANFVSACLNAGDLHQSDDWYYHFMFQVGNRVAGSYSLSWTSAREQHRIFSNPDYSYSNEQVVIWSMDGIKYHAKNSGIKKGDLMYFCHAEGDVYHAAIIVEVTEDEIYYNAHTKQRNHEPLSSHFDGNPVVIVKMRDDA